MALQHFLACSINAGDEEDDHEGSLAEEEADDGSASNDSDEMLDVERKAREIDRDRYMPASHGSYLRAEADSVRESP